MTEERYPRVGPSFFPGLVIIVIGVVLLLNRFEFVRPLALLDYWPLLLVILGMHRIFASRQPGMMIMGGLIALIGVLLLGQRLGYFDFDWYTVFPVLVIVIGVMALARSLQHNARLPSIPTSSQAILNEWVLFGGCKMVNTSRDFRGGELLAVFGGYQLDLTRTEMAGDEAVLKLTAVFGGMEVRTPESWVVVVKGVPVFGGIEDKTLHPKGDSTVSQKTLVISGLAIFGGIEVRN